MKTPSQVLVDVGRRLVNSWAWSLAQEATPAFAVGGRVLLTSNLAAESCCAVNPPDRSPNGRAVEQAREIWPHAFPLGKVAASAAEADFPALVNAVATWRGWTTEHRLELRWESRRLLGTPQLIPTHLVVDTIDAAAEVVGAPWPGRIARGRDRAAVLASRYPHLSSAPPVSLTQDRSEVEDFDTAATTDASAGPPGPPGPPGAARLDLRRILRALDDLSDVDFDLICRAGDWFRSHDARGLTPRQVPIEGLHAKWLNTRRHLVRALADVDDLGLAVTHPPRIHFTYLDPDHRATGGRIHDSATIGDAVAPAYVPRTVIISENKDTALYFPELPAAISVEGVGRGGSTIAAFPWITGAEAVFYWGDMDADGLEILNEFRAAGVPATAILMDVASYETWERFGTNRDVNGQELTARTPRSVSHLTTAEAELYRRLASPTWDRHRRIEQERIPLSAARRAVLEAWL